MAKIWEIYKVDWIRIFHSKAAVVLIIALMILPSLYAWFNIKALWDPYGNTSGLHVAVANDDTGFTFRGESVNIGNQVVETLKKDKKLGWVFVDHATAEKEVRQGKYYASIYIPRNFSKNMASILTGDLVKPEIIYTVNDKINAIAPKITSKGASTIASSVSSQFIETVSQELLSAFKQTGVELEKELPTIRGMESKLYDIQAAIPKMNEFGSQIISLNQNMPAIQEKVKKVTGYTEYIPAIDELGANVLKVRDALPEIENAGEKIAVLEERLPDIQQAANAVDSLTNDFDSIHQSLNAAISEAKKASKVINQVQTVLPEVEELMETGSGYTSVVKEFADQLSASFDVIEQMIQTNLQIAHTSAKTITSSLSVSGADTAAIRSQLTRLSTMLGTQSQLVEGIKSTNGNLSDFAQKLTKAQNLAQSALQSLDNGDVTTAQTQAGQIQALIEGLLSGYEETFKAAIEQGLAGLSSHIEKTDQVLQTLNEQLPAIKSILVNAGAITNSTIETLEKYESAFPDMASSIEKASEAIQSNMDTFINGVTLANDFFETKYLQAKESIEQGSSFVENEWPKLSKELTSSAELIDERMPRIVKAVEIAADLAANDLPLFTAKINEATEKLTEAKGEINVEELIQFLRLDVQTDSDFLSNPINLKEVTEYPIANYGSASTPFYTTLAIWVGVVLLVSMLSVDVHMREGKWTASQVYFGRGLTFLTIALTQTAIIALGDIFLIKADIAERGKFILFSLLIAVVFTALIYTFVSVFGNIGKGLAIILLVLQVAGSGSNFPIEVSSSFFQHIYPFLPFTYAVKLLRESVGGIYWPTAIQCIVVLSGITILFGLFGTLFKKPLARIVNKFNEEAKKSKIIH